MWNNFEIYSIITLVSWLFAICLIVIKNKNTRLISEVLSIIGILSLSFFTIKLWIDLERPPMRTLGETRLWYSLFLSIIGYVIYKRWNYKLFLFYSLLMALLFLFINFLNPDIRSKTLMPALQSIWFVPHVIVYIIAYAFLGFSSLMGGIGLYHVYKHKEEKHIFQMAVNIVYIGFGFLSLGLIFGALWAKEAWGGFWTWDPKETWALLTWGVYLVFIHLEIKNSKTSKFYFVFLLVSFVVLLLSWFGVNYMPVAQNSVHVYSN